MAKKKEIQYEDFLISFREALQQQSDEYLDQFDEHAAFNYVIADLFASTSDDQFTYSDGPRDGGIDFFTRNSPAYEIVQCKCPELANLSSSEGPHCFADDGLNELLSGVRYLLSKDGKLDVKTEIKRLRSQYQRDLTDTPDACTLTAVLAVAGYLSGPAKGQFEAAKKEFSERGVKLRLIEWKEIARQLRSPDDVAEAVSVELNIGDPKTELLRQKDSCYFLANAFDFYSAFQLFEWQLFDWNVRLQLHNSPINAKIVQSLLLDRTRKKFHHLNNGILIACQNFAIHESKRTITINGAQIINGCQTVRAICDAYDEMEPRQQDLFRSDTKVQVKIIQNVDQDFIGELSVSTNNQNPMNARNLRSNYSEQKELQKLFRELPQKWFYERKDGEFKSLVSASSKIRWFRKSDYVGGGKPRLVENEVLAKVWYAFTGNSDKALLGGVDYFDDNEIYGRVFSSSPNDMFWEKFRQPSLTGISEEDFTNFAPNPYQYLLAVVLGKLADSQRVPSAKNKEKAIERAVRDGVLKGDPHTGQCRDIKENVDKFLAGDEDYKLNIMLANMREVLIELSAFLLVRKYGKLSPEVCQSILLGTDANQFMVKGFDSTAVPSFECNDTAVIGPVYAFLRDCVKQYRIANRAEIDAAPRTKTYLSQRVTVTKLREHIIHQDGLVRDLRVPWKQEGLTFLEGLPSLATPARSNGK